ncbi:penicillin-binding protein activator LpoB [Candidatus Fukatsuia anoeciicola]|uniref:penicillin-binding protein activator LpoB n=1 Tax=Candidatus Fukatsuia anoeciicola TaxID=2994492 RepID=UPI003463AD59
MKRYLFIVLVILILTGCPLQPPDRLQLPVVIKPLKLLPPPKIVSSTTDTVLQMPKIKSINWVANIEPFMVKMLNINNITIGSTLLLDSVKNNTNGKLQADKVTEALHQVLISNKKFILVSNYQLAKAKRTLGLSEEDSLGSRSKAVSLARYINTKYVLYSDIKGDSKAPIIDMQLILVQTGEIIWSDNGPINLKDS